MPTVALEPAECLELLATQSVGRLAVVAGDYPLVVPVNFSLDDSTVVFRTAPGSKLHAATYRNVAFEVDDIDHVNRSGWSVLLTGRAEVISQERNPELLRRVMSLEIRPYDTDDKPVWVRIVTKAISGRRVGPSRALFFDLPSDAYL